MLNPIKCKICVLICYFIINAMQMFVLYSLRAYLFNIWSIFCLIFSIFNQNCVFFNVVCTFCKFGQMVELKFIENYCKFFIDTIFENEGVKINLGCNT